MLDNKAVKYYRNIETPSNILTDYDSKEAENKIRIDRNLSFGDYQLSTGANINFAKYENQSVVKQVNQNAVDFDEYNSEINFMQYGFYIQTAKKYFEELLQVSLGARIDASNYSDKTSYPLDQFSPRFSLRLKLNDAFALNVNSGIYYQLPPYTSLGFQVNDVLVNKNTLKYIRNSQIVGGIEFNGKDNLRFTAEAYYKRYSNYPFSLRNQISLANLGGDFGVIGAEPVDSRGKGKTYGIEFLVQKRTINNFYGIAAYTFGYSKFSDVNNVFSASSWDSRHIFTLTAGKYFKRNWNLSARFRMQSGLPETPYDLTRSALVDIWNVANGPVKNYTQLNSLRGNTAHQLDIRAEKKWIFKKWQLTAYMDVVNVYGSKNPSALPVVNLQRDANDNGIVANPSAPQNQQYYLLDVGTSDRSMPLPYFGFIFEF